MTNPSAPKPNPIRSDAMTPLERHKKIKVKEAAALNDVSEATFRRHYKHLIIKVTPRRDAVALEDALTLPPPGAKTVAT